MVCKQDTTGQVSLSFCGPVLGRALEEKRKEEEAQREEERQKVEAKERKKAKAPKAKDEEEEMRALNARGAADLAAHKNKVSGISALKSTSSALLVVLLWEQ